MTKLPWLLLPRPISLLLVEAAPMEDVEEEAAVRVLVPTATKLLDSMLPQDILQQVLLEVVEAVAALVCLVAVATTPLLNHRLARAPLKATTTAKGATLWDMKLPSCTLHNDLHSHHLVLLTRVALERLAMLEQWGITKMH